MTVCLKERHAIADEVRLQLAECIRQMQNHSIRTSLLSSLAFAMVMLQGGCSLTGNLDSVAQGNSAQAEPTVTVHPRIYKVAGVF
ncbi:MAG: hypothetical protein ABIU05_00855 [Nitrospirales bacterium]